MGNTARYHNEKVIRRAGYRCTIPMPFLPVAGILIFGIPLAFYLGAATFIALIATATLGMLVLREGSSVPFPWHVNMARITIVIAVIHAVVVYLTFF